MNNFFGAVTHGLSSANIVHIVWCSTFIGFMLILAVLHHFWKNSDRLMILWRIMCLFPLAASAVHYFIYAAGLPYAYSDFILLYVVAVLCAIPLFFAKRRVGYVICSVLTGLCSVLTGFYFSVQSPNTYNFSKMSYTDSFTALLDKMNEKYVLKEWKEVDFQALKEKYLPRVSEAEQTQDELAFSLAVQECMWELNDGHVFTASDIPDMDSARDFHDFGLLMVKTDNGDTIAVSVDEQTEGYGIHNGTKILTWGGNQIDDAAEYMQDFGRSVFSNEEFLRPMYLAASSQDYVQLTYIDDNGEEMFARIPELDEKPERLIKGISLLNHTEKDENFSTKMIDDKCGYLALNAESTSTFEDIKAYITGDHSYAREMFREKLRDLRAQGMKYLVVDLRNNMGGFDEIGCALASLFTEDDYYGQGLGIRKNGSYRCVSDHNVNGDGEFADISVVVLTNMDCASAGDGTSLYLSKLPNVTLAGITDPSGCNQETGGTCYLSGGKVIVGFPVGLILDENGVPNIDTKADRISRNPVEVRIPFDKDAAVQIFSGEGDYELEWAVNYLEKVS